MHLAYHALTIVPLVSIPRLVRHIRLFQLEITTSPDKSASVAQWESIYQINNPAIFRDVHRCMATTEPFQQNITTITAENQTMADL